MVKPICTNAQSQRMVVTLRNICRDYPAGGGILRELLQNADDAGATQVCFVLDENTHPSSPLIHEHLARFQGPALLAYNSAEFKDKDFENLKHTGDSYKLDDGTTTGRFGRGFNSVYNWTDSPSLVSRNRLLILDPHEWWSRDMGVSPVFDFVKEHEDPEIVNQMQAFSTIMTDTTKPFDGTIIRIPLRTETQATESEIVDCAVTVEEVRKVLSDFAKEFSKGGLLFMRNVEQAEVRATSGLAVDISIANLETVRAARTEVKAALQSAAQGTDPKFDCSFDAVFKHKSRNRTETVKFAIHHQIHLHLEDESLQNWMKKHRITPWVAVAAPLQSSGFEGTLFAVLPLPIPNAQAVHIHGLFSISPDRARLNVKDVNISDQSPALWNQYLFEHPIPQAWSKLLGYIASNHLPTSTFAWWPVSSQDQRDPLKDSLSLVIDRIQQEKLAVFPTVNGYATAEQSLLCTGTESAGLIKALREAKLSFFQAPVKLKDALRSLFATRTVCPELVSKELYAHLGNVETCSSITKHKILEYLVTAVPKVDYEALEIFPFEDGSHHSTLTGDAFVHRNSEERDLFGDQSSKNIDCKQLSQSCTQALYDLCSHAGAHSVIRFRGLVDFTSFCKNNMFGDIPEGAQDIVLADIKPGFLAQAWSWIGVHDPELQDIGITSLWLLPLLDGTYRKLKPSDVSMKVMVTKPGDMGGLLKLLGKDLSSYTPRLVDVDRMGVKNCQLLLDDTSLDHLSLMSSERLLDISEWLSSNFAMVRKMSDREKKAVLKALAKLMRNGTAIPETAKVLSSIRSLEIFPRAVYLQRRTKKVMSTSWTTLQSYDNTVAVLEPISVLLSVHQSQVLPIEPKGDTHTILDFLGAIPVYDDIQFISEYIMPNFTQSSSDYGCKLDIMEFILSKYPLMPPRVRKQLRELPCTPVASLNGNVPGVFALATSLIDPELPQAKQLFFDDEEVFPEHDFYQKYTTILKLCGLKTAIDDDIAQLRTQAYAQRNCPTEDIKVRVHSLLEYPYQRRTTGFAGLRTLAWLPAMVDGVLQRVPASKCRSSDDVLLCGLVTPTIDVRVSQEWKSVLGWDKPISDDILLQQLRRGIERHSTAIVDAVLRVIVDIEPLKLISFILTDQGTFSTPFTTFKTGCYGLHPYSSNVEHLFWTCHESLLRKCGVRQIPEFEDLISIQDSLEAKGTLTLEQDIAVAVKLASRLSFYDGERLKQAKIISRVGNLHSAQDLVCPNVEEFVGEHYTWSHSEITPATAAKLGIEFLSNLRQKNALGIEDFEDDDEFEQKESVTTRIRDTLDRYPIESTFREYLANTEDAGATKIAWMVDERSHPNEGLITQHSEKLQGPALLVHNDSVFGENDFKGFMNVGEGSKRQNASVIGQFGRGSQTMYHFTDTPMLISGSQLIILDPQQEILHYSPKKGRRLSGVNIDLKKVRVGCPGHLSPFDKLFEFTASMDYYPGTIFRFPLRTAASSSQLHDASQFLDGASVRQRLVTYFEEARISLLFLKNVREISYRIQHSNQTQWSVSQNSTDMSDNIVNAIRTTITSVSFNAPNCKFSASYQWRIANSEVDTPTPSLPTSSHSRVFKKVECGVAALINTELGDNSSRAELAKCPTIIPKIFSALPLPLDSKLPVHIHATFSLSGDRRSLVIGEDGSETHAAWNNHLLQESLPELYLELLEDLTESHPNQVLNFWPRTLSFTGNCTLHLFNSFKEKLYTSPRRLYLQLQNDKLSPRRRLTFQESVFQLNAAIDLGSITPLVLSLGVPLVDNLPAAVSNALSKDERAERVTETSLRKLFTTAKSRKLLQEVLSRMPPVFNHLLKLVLSRDRLEELHSCCFIRLENEELGVLKCRTKLKNPEIIDYFIVTQIESKIFDFAHKILVSNTHWEPINAICNEDTFNVGKLKLIHLPELFKHYDASQTLDRKWLERFWTYWNSRINQQSEARSSLENLPVCLVKRGGTEQNARLSDLDSRAAVINPQELSHQAICDKFGLLHRFDHEFVPKDLAEQERSFFNGRAFYRFIKALHQLCPSGQSFGQYVTSKLSQNEHHAFRQLVVAHARLYNNLTDSKGVSCTFEDIKVYLADVPLWKSCNMNFPRLLSASELCIIAEEGTNDLLVPWMRNYDLFVSERTHLPTLTFLGAKRLSWQDVLRLNIFPIPALSVGDSNWVSYLRLVQHITFVWRQIPMPVSFFQKNLISVDQNLRLVRADCLYDHEDRLFTAAFRHEANTRFLHDDLKSHHNMWLGLGLQQTTNNVLCGATYIKCLQLLDERYKTRQISPDPHLGNDSEELLRPLLTMSVRTSYLTGAEWQTIAALPIFQSTVNVNSQPSYRRQAMTTMATGHPFLKLKDIILESYASACWSQTPFALTPPASAVLDRFTSGKPTVLMVWRHLLHLKDMTHYLRSEHVRDFLQDLTETYTFLQENNCDEISASERLQDLWLNLPSLEGGLMFLDDVRDQWVSAKNLVLSSSCDAGDKKAVKAGLMRFEPLLRKMGSSSVIYPTIERPTAHEGHSIGQALTALRASGNMFDAVHYHSQNQVVIAHRLVLAAISPTCARQFSDQWSGNVPKDDNGAFQFYFNELDAEGQPDESFLSHHTLKTIVDYAYDSRIEWTDMQITTGDDADAKQTKFDKLLDLLHGADYLLIDPLRSEVQGQILDAGKQLITIANIKTTLRKARLYNADKVADYCVEFLDCNKDVIGDLMEEGEADDEDEDEEEETRSDEAGEATLSVEE